jgi:Flp pilus assembly protein TadD
MPLLLRLQTAAAVSLLALGLSGCLTKDKFDITGSIKQPAAAATVSEDNWRAQAEEWGKRYDEKPGEKQVSMNYARALRALDQRQQAVAVLQSAALKAPKDMEILAAYGKALAENGDLQQAQQVLSKAHTPERPDWRVLSALGAVSDQMGDHAGAQSLYEAALKIQPDDAGVLSNLGLSLALSRKLPEAETTLRRAVALPGADLRTRQNLALVLGLQGKFTEAEEVARRDLPPAEAAQSIASVRQMISQTNSWSKIRSIDAKAPAAKAQKTKAPPTQDPGSDPGAPASDPG